MSDITDLTVIDDLIDVTNVTVTADVTTIGPVTDSTVILETGRGGPPGHGTGLPAGGGVTDVITNTSPGHGAWTDTDALMVHTSINDSSPKVTVPEAFQAIRDDASAEADSAASAAVSFHIAATDPHGDRAFATAADAALLISAGSDATSKVAAEAALRTSGDATNASAITAEATTRGNADTAEAASRVSGDAASVSTAAADATSKVAAEAALRVTGDAASVSTAASDATTKAAAAQAAAIAASQPVDSDLTAIAALSTTAYGRGLLALADAAAGRTSLGLGTASVKDAPASGDATTAQVLLGADTQLRNNRLRALRSLTRSKTKAASSSRLWVIDGDSYAYGALGTPGTDSFFDILNAFFATKYLGKKYQTPKGGWRECSGSLYTWANLASGTAVASGPAKGSYKTTANNTSIGDTTVACTAISWLFDKYPSGTATFDAVVDGVTVATAQSVTDGALSGGQSGYMLTITGLTYAAHTFTLKQNGAGQVVHNGYIAHNGTETAGVMVMSHGVGGTTTGDWSTTGFGTYLQGTLDVITNNTNVDVVMNVVGANDKWTAAPIAQATSAANLKTTIQAQQAIRATLGVVVLIEPYLAKPSLGNVSGGNTAVTYAQWRDVWVPAYKQVCVDTGALSIDLDALFGNISEGNDPYTWTIDGGLHTGTDGQLAIANEILTEINLAPITTPAILVDGSVKMQAALDLNAQNLTNAAAGTFSGLLTSGSSTTGAATATGLTINTGHGKFVTTEILNVPQITGYVATADANATMYYGADGIRSGPTSGTADNSFTRSGVGVWTIGTGNLIVGTASAGTHAMNRDTVDARIGVPDGTTVQVSGSVLSVKGLGIGTSQLAANAVTLAKMATQADQTILGNNAGSTAVPTALTPANVRKVAKLTTAADAGVLVASSIAETTVLVSTTSLQIPANTIVAKDPYQLVFLIKMGSFGGASTFRWRPKIGTTALLDFTTASFPNSSSVVYGKITVDLVWNTAGASGKLNAWARMEYTTNQVGSGAISPLTTVQGAMTELLAVDTTAAVNFNLTVQNSASGAAIGGACLGATLQQMGAV